MLTAVSAQAAEGESCFCFADLEQKNLQGVCIVDVPQTGCWVSCGARTIRAGDILTTEQMAQMQITATSPMNMVAALSYLPVYADGVGAVETLRFSLRGTEDACPVARDSCVETYKNIAVSAAPNCEDPEGDALIYTILRKPKRGTVVWNADGTFTYTPKAEKVGEDYFTYMAEDPAGNQSEEAKVCVTILKCSSRDVFADMVGDPQELEAVFLRKHDIYSGISIGSVSCFYPEQTVSYEEFLMMLMKLTGLSAEETAQTDWFAPWQTAAFRAGLTRGSENDGFDQMDAAVLTAGILDLQLPQSVTVFSNAETDVQAACMEALEQAGLSCFAEGDLETVTRRDAARILYTIHQYCEENQIVFPWQR